MATQGRVPPEEGADHGRLEREAHFHDHVFAEDARQAAGRFYAVAQRSKRLYRERVLRGGDGLDVLEYGCGPGSCAFDLARAGARVTGIDISPGAIELAKAQAEAEGLSEALSSGRLRFEVMNAEALSVADDSFDRICGSGILHHLDLSRALPEITRILRPTGDAVFFEPLGHNLLINWYRRRTPSMRTIDEHPLLAADLARLDTHFEHTRYGYHHLTALAASVWSGRIGFALLLGVLDTVDRILLRVPGIRRQAWIVIAELRNPRSLQAPGQRL
ncbi:MAG: methyltransferase domain-containing protein [Gemmatimonadetes bacterium]|jgi:SAM-dependent methyltransferase|nr:methyltransferase domain-containing protein [Gemmatimonadota bacterium]